MYSDFIDLSSDSTDSNDDINQNHDKKIDILSNDNAELIPKLSTSKNFIKLDFPNINISQVEYSEGPVGLTYIQYINAARVHMEVRGSWPAYINMLSNNEKHILSGINIAGGSALGLEATSGIVAESLRKSDYVNWIGVNGTNIYSQNLNKNKIYPDKNLGRFAYNNFTQKLYNGQVGAGLSASHGQGWSYKKFENGIKVLILVVNNAIIDVHEDNEIINKNTTIIVVTTNLDLDNDELKQMNQRLTDGDIMYTCSTREINNYYDMIQLINFFNECSELLKEAIFNSILKK